MIREIREELRTGAAFAIFSACMYRPTREGYIAMVDEVLADPEALCLGVFHEGELTGVLIATGGEILGAAVREDARGKGVGRALILRAAEAFPTLTAETDGDSVGFYRACGFSCTEFEHAFPDGFCTRYRCALKFS